MKKIFLVATVFSVVAFTSCKEKASKKIKSENVVIAAERDEAAKALPIMSFDKSEHDFGTITKGAAQETVFTFTNTGTGPLIITNAKSSCGCTIPEYPKNTPIAPGDSGELVVKFNGSGQNQVTKTITVTANTEKKSETLRIKAFVNAANVAKVGPTVK